MSDIKVKAAEDAIEAVFSDSSVSLETARDRLESLLGRLEMYIDAIEGDIARAAEKAE